MGYIGTGMTPQPLMTEMDMLARLRSGEVRVPPLDVLWTAIGRAQAPDAMAQVSWGGRSFRFVVELKARNIPKVFSGALTQARTLAETTGDNPMVVLPYLAPERLEELERAGVSGIDLCGNAIVMVPGKLFVLRTGAKNRFRESYPIREVYRGTTSLVPRALLLRPVTQSLSDLDRFIRSRGGETTLTTISKALRRMEDDVLIERRGGKARLLQPRELLERLAAAYKPPKVNRTFAGLTQLKPDALATRLATAPETIVLTGQSSTSRYAVMGREDRSRFYCPSLPAAIQSLGSAAKETDRFVNLELLETSDPTVYFDAREDGQLRFASPIQTFLELQAGDKREQETAVQVRDQILGETKRLLEQQ